MSEPKTKIIRYQETVFICSCCDAETRSIYQHTGQWSCLPCLKELGNRLGIRVNSFYDPQKFIEDHRLAGRVTRTGPPRQQATKLHCYATTTRGITDDRNA
jgi:hypothetical protein